MDDRIDVKFGAILGEFFAGLGQAQTALKESVDGMKAELESLTATADAVMAPFLAISAFLAGGGLFAEGIESTLNFAKQLEVTAQKTGIAVEQLSALKHAADLTNVSFEQVTIGLQRLSRAMEESETGVGKANDAFKALGINTQDAEGHLRALHDVLLELADPFAAMQDGAGKTAIAMDLFGRSGADLIPLLNQGAAGIEQMEARARALGLTMGKDDVEAALAFHEKIVGLKAAWDGFIRGLVIEAIPALEISLRFFQDLADIVGAATHAFIGLGAAMSGDMKRAAAEAKKAMDLLNADPTRHMHGAPRSIFGGGGGADAPTVGTNKAEAEAQKKAFELFLKDLGEMAKAQDKFLKDTQKEWIETFNAIPQAFEATMKTLQRHGGTFHDFMSQMLRDLLREFVVAEAKIVEAHAAMWLARKNITVAGVAEEIAVEGINAAIWVANEAAKAAAAAWAAMSGVPFVGPILGPAAAAAALAGVLDLGSHIRSAAGGYDIPAGLNPITQLHAQEMVLPAGLANAVRDMASGGSSGNHFHIHGVDAVDISRWATRPRNQRAIGVAAVAHIKSGGFRR